MSAADPQPRHAYRFDLADEDAPIVCDCGQRFGGFLAWSQHVMNEEDCIR